LKFLGEVDHAIANSSVGRREEILRRVTDLFIIGATQLSDEEVGLFDEVIARLAVEIELSARALLAIRLAPIPNAPPRTIRDLAFDDALEVAAPVLSQSERLDDADLVENARIKGQGHMLAISRRRQLSEAITDILIERGDKQVLLSTVENRGARLSNNGFSVLVQRAEGNERLAVSVGERTEIPPGLYRQLLARASQKARAKLEAAHPELSREICAAVEEVSSRIELETLASPAECREALVSVEAAQRSDQLNDGAVKKLASAGALAEVTSALGILAILPVPFVEKLMTDQRSDGLLVLARAIGLSWSTVEAILRLPSDKRLISEVEIAQCLASYERLKPETAREILLYYRTRENRGPAGPKSNTTPRLQ